MRLLMVCLGNICRSPLAEGALRARLNLARLADQVEVDSAGTGDWHVGEPPDHRSIAVAAAEGVDISDQRARKLHDADFEHFDWLLCADHSVVSQVRARTPTHVADRVVLLMEWAGLGAGVEVPDPYTGGPEDFRRVWSMVDTAAAGIVARLASGSSSHQAVDARPRIKGC